MASKRERTKTSSTSVFHYCACACLRLFSSLALKNESPYIRRSALSNRSRERERPALHRNRNPPSPPPLPPARSHPSLERRKLVPLFPSLSSPRALEPQARAAATLRLRRPTATFSSFKSTLRPEDIDYSRSQGGQRTPKLKGRLPTSSEEKSEQQKNSSDLVFFETSPLSYDCKSR